MKTTSLTFFLALSAVLYGQESKELTTLRATWTQARQQALKPIDTKYAAALAALKDKLTKAGNTDGVLQVDAELGKIGKELGQLPEVAPKIEEQMAGDWEMRTSEGWSSMYKIHANGAVWRPENGRPTRVATWAVSQDGKTLFIRYTRDYGAVDKFNLPMVGGAITGSNDRGTGLTLTKQAE